MTAPGDGEVLVRNACVSVDPAMRGWMNAGKSYVPPVGVGDVMRAYAGGTVVASRHPDFAEGDAVTGVLGVLGMTGMTAYFGVLDVGEHREGDVVVVSGAAGAVGSVAGQIAKIRGSFAVGIAGGPEKCRYVVDDLGFDACIDYKSEDVRQRLAALCPGGVDLYFDNVGGTILDDVLTRLALHARIVIGGAISQYNAGAVHGPVNYLQLLVMRATMRGMLIIDFADRYAEAAQGDGGMAGRGASSAPRGYRGRDRAVPRRAHAPVPRAECRQAPVATESGVM